MSQEDDESPLSGHVCDVSRDMQGGYIATLLGSAPHCPPGFVGSFLSRAGASLLAWPLQA
jgi:hypothetical protein